MTREHKRWTYWVAIGVTILGGVIAATATAGGLVTQVDALQDEAERARDERRELHKSVVELRAPLKRIDDLVWELRELRLRETKPIKPHQ